MILKTISLTKHFEGVSAVHKVDLEINEGEISCIIGPNGAGKSTLFNVITGNILSDSGQIFFKGEDITGHPPHTLCRKGISRSFQKVSVFPCFTVFENVQTAILAGRGKCLDMFRPAKGMFVEETNELLEMTGLSVLAKKTCDSLSHGDKKLVEFGIALANQPSLLLLDEPTAGMSPAEAGSIMNFVVKLSREKGITLLFVEHDMKIVFDHAEIIRVMHIGELIAVGTPEEIRKNEHVKRIYLGEVE